MAYTTPKKYTTGASPELSAYLQRNRERYDISKPTKESQISPLYKTLPKTSQSSEPLYKISEQAELAKKQIEVEQVPKQSWLGNLGAKASATGQSLGAKLGTDVISTVRTVTGTAERLQASLMGGENQTVPEAMAEAYKNIVQGKEVGKNLTNLFKGLVPGIGIIPEIAKANTVFVGNVAQDATQGKFNFGQRAVESMQETAFGALTSRTAPSTADRALLDTENKLRAKSEQADARLGDIGGAVTSGIGSLPSSLMASATPFGLGYAAMFLRSFRTSQEEAWAIENTTGRKLSDKDVYLYAISNGALEVATESAFNKLGAGLGKLTSKLSGGTRGANLANAQGWLGTLVRKTFLKIGGEATTEALEKVGKNAVVKTIKDMGKSAVGEGLEEVFNAIGAGVVSKYTINPNASLNFLDKESQWYYRALGLAFLSGASGGFVGGIPHGVANWLDRHGNKTLDEVVNDPEAMSSLDETLAVSAQREDVQERIEQTAVDVLQKAESEYVAEEPEASTATTMPAEAPTMAQNAIEAQAQESATTVAQAVAEPSRAVEQYANKNVGFHFGDLGKAEFLANTEGSRNTGSYGTGTYFISNQESIDRMNEQTYKDRPLYAVDFSDYNLYKPNGRTDANRLHEFLKQINKRATGSRRYLTSPNILYLEAKSLFGDTVGTYEQFLKKVASYRQYVIKNRELDINASVEKSGKRFDSPSTLFMKSMGYDGVDVRGINGFDDEQYGSVIYDLKQPKKEQPKPTSKPVESVVEPKKRNYAKEVYEKQQRGESVESDVREYLQTDEGKALIADVKAEEDVAVKIAEITSEIEQGNASTHKLTRWNLQLLAYRSLADKLKSTPVGSEISRAVVHLIDAMTTNKPEEIKRAIEGEFSSEKLFYRIFTNEKALVIAKHKLKTAKKRGVSADSFSNALLDELYSSGRIPTPDENAILFDYIKRLSEQADEDGGFSKVANVVEKIVKLGTRGGQFIQSFRMIKAIFPDMQARKIIKSYKKTVDIPQSDLNEAEREAEKIVEAVKKDRKKAVKDATAEVEKKIKAEKFPKDSIVPAALSFEKYIKHIAEITVRDKRERTLNQKIVTQLVEKFKQAYNLRTEKIKDDPYAILAEIIANRSKYALVWDTVKDYLKNDKIFQDRTYFDKDTGENGDFYSFVNDVFVSADPAAAPTALRRVVRANIEDMKVSLEELAYNYFMQGNESLTGFFESLRSKFPEMDDASYNYLRESIRKEFIDMLDIKRMQSVRAVIEATKRSANKKKIKTQEEVITDMLSKATYYEAFDIPEIRDLWAQKAGLPVLTEENIQTIYKAMHDIAKAKTEQQKDEIYRSMVDELAKYIKATKVEKFQAWLRTAMLLNPSTILGNPLANMIAYPYYKVMDKLQNKIMRIVKAPESDLFAQDKVAKYNPTDAIGKIVELKTTQKELAYVLAMSAKYNLHTVVKQNAPIFQTAWIEKLNRIPFDAMSTGKIGKRTFKMLGDYGMFEKHYRNAMYNKMLAMGYNESMPKAERDNIIATASEYGADMAIMRTFRAMNIVSNMLKNLQKSAMFYDRIKALEEQNTPTSLARADALRKAGKAAQMAVKVISPFVVTPAALVAESYKFSPIALIKTLVVDYGVAKINGRWNNPGHRSVYAQNVSQALVGTVGQFAVGFALAAFGLMTGGLPDDEKEKELWKVEGKKPYSIRIPGLGWVPIDWAQPISTVLMMGAQVHQSIEQADTFGEFASAPLTGTVGVLIKESIYSNIKRMFGTGYGSETGTEGLESVLTGGLFQALPSVLLRINRTLDPVTRDPYYGSAIQQLLNRALLYVPFASYMVKAKVDIWGNEIRYSKAKGVAGIFQRFFLNTVAPFTLSEDRQDNVTREVTRVYNATSDSNALPSLVEGTIDNIELTAEEYEWYQKQVGQLCYNKIKEYIARGDYSGKTDEEKVKAFEKIYSKARESVRNEYRKTHKNP